MVFSEQLDNKYKFGYLHIKVVAILSTLSLSNPNLCILKVATWQGVVLWTKTKAVQQGMYTVLTYICTYVA
jgi:hypothetical protein